jgi:KinB signaling pathway activation protein
VSKLKIKNWLFLFLSTSLLGGATVILTVLVLGWGDIAGVKDTFGEFFAAAIWLFVVGLMFSVISQMGFFAYLMVHRFGLGIFKSHRLWNRIQIVLILFTFFDLVYLRLLAFSEPGETWIDYMMLPTILLIIAIIVGYLKARVTNQTAFVPAIFFIFVVTSVEIVPALTQNDPTWVTLMLVPILVCNIWQLLILQRLTSVENQKSA